MFVYILYILYLSDTSIDQDVHYVKKQVLFVHTLYVLVNVSITLSPNISLPTHAVYTSVVLYVIFSLYTWSLGVISLNHFLPHKKQCCVLFSVYFYILCLINDNGHPNNRTPTIMLLDFTAALFNNAFLPFHTDNW